MNERDMWFKDRIESLEGKVTALEIECGTLRGKKQQLRSALSAYRSALRSRERESDQLREFGEAALSDQSEVSNG